MALVAQWIEQSVSTRQVEGSSPSECACENFSYFKEITMKIKLLLVLLVSVLFMSCQPQVIEVERRDGEYVGRVVEGKELEQYREENSTFIDNNLDTIFSVKGWIIASMLQMALSYAAWVLVFDVERTNQDEFIQYLFWAFLIAVVCGPIALILSLISALFISVAALLERITYGPS